MKALRFNLLLLLTYVYAVGAEICTAVDGSCNWTDEIGCEHSEKYCEENSQCFVVTKSANSSYPLTAYHSTLLAMCRCIGKETGHCAISSTRGAVSRNVKTECNHNQEVQALNPPSEDTLIEVFHARMWSTTDGSAPNCGNYGEGMHYIYLPNVLALVRFWCQYKESCTFSTSKLLTYVGSSSLLQRSFTFELSYAHTQKDDVYLTCELNHYYHEETRSCYALTSMTSNWNKARAECLRQGGDLAHFSEATNFMDILRHFNPSLGHETNQSSAVKIWFKWYSWDGLQRKAQEFEETAERFACEIYDYGTIPAFARCYSLQAGVKAQGICVLPPISPDLRPMEYDAFTCPAKTVNVAGYPTNWNATEAGVTVQASCPGNLTGMVYWKCGANGHWETPSPDSSGCSNPVAANSINHANQQLESGNDPAQALASLSKDIGSTILAAGNLQPLDNTINLAIVKQGELLENTSEANVREMISKNFTSSITDLSDIMLSNTEAFWGLGLEERFKTVDSVQKNIDNSLNMMALNLVLDSMYQKRNQTLALRAESRPRAGFNSTGYCLSLDASNEISLPPGFQNLAEEVNGKVQLSLVGYTGFPSLLHGDSLLLFEEEWWASENSLETRPPSLKEIVNTFVLGATLGEPNSSVSLGANIVDANNCTFDTDDYVEVTLLILNSSRYRSSNRRCVYWDVTTQTWSDKGCCLVPNTAENSAVCRCNHLTNFAVIMDINGIFANQTILALEYITVIGESISIVCLTLAVCVFFWVRTLRREFRFRIHRNLCLSLLLAEILLLSGLDATFNPGLCTTIAVFLHLFFLCAFGWMLVEGLFLYFLITKVFNGSGLKPWHYYVIGYGLPVLIVVITLASTQAQAYISNGTTCWLNVDNGGIWAFAGPVAAVVLANVIFLMVALMTTFKIQRQNREKKLKGPGFRQVFGAFTLTFILGITWIFGFLYLNESTIVLAYIFTVLNSLQGLVIFLALCVLNKQVRNDFMRQLVSSEAVQRLSECFNVDIVEWQSKANRSTQRTNPGSSTHLPSHQTLSSIHSNNYSH